MCPGVETAIFIVIVYIMFANFRFKKAVLDESKEDANKSVEIVREVNRNKPRPLDDVELQYPLKDLWRGPLLTRGKWMEVKNEFFRFSRENEDERGVTPIKLEGWVEERTYHYLLCSYGDLYTTRVNWDGWLVTLNVVACQSVIPVDDMPRVIETGSSLAFVVSSEVFNFYRENAKAETAEGEVDIGRKFIMHCIIDKRAVPGDFDASAFKDWPAGMVNDLIAMRRPGETYPVFTPEELGLVRAELPGDESQDQGPEVGERLMEEVEAEPTKSGATPVMVEEELGGSPKLAEQESKVRNDVDVVHRRRKDRKQGRGARRRKFRKMIRSPLKLSREQELWIVSQLVLGVEPNATASRIRENYEEILRNRGEALLETDDEFLSQYGSAHGGWNLSASDREDIARLNKTNTSPTTSSRASTSPLPPLIESTSSSILSPRAELSQNLGSAASMDSSGPASKRRRRGTEESRNSSVAMSPFLAMKSSGGRVVSISSSSSEGTVRSGTKKTRVNLGELLSSGRIDFPDDGLLTTIELDVFEEDVREMHGDVFQDEGDKDEDPSSED